MANTKTPEAYQDCSTLVLGGSSGIGLEAVAQLRRLEVEDVYIGTSQPEHFNNALLILERREKVDTSGVYPFVADVTDKTQIAKAAIEMKDRGPTPRFVIFSQAGGMETITQPLFRQPGGYLTEIDKITHVTPIDELDEEKRGIVREKIEAMRRDLEVMVEEAKPHAEAVNFHGTFNVIQVLGNTFPDGFTGVFYNSTWGHLSGTPGIEIPLLYRPVDLSKAKVRDRLQQEGISLRDRGIPMCELVASLVRDTKVGKMFYDFLLNLMCKEQRDAIQNSTIYSQEVVLATRAIMEGSPDDWQTYPRVSYVYKRNEVVVNTDELELSAMYTLPYLF